MSSTPNQQLRKGLVMAVMRLTAFTPKPGNEERVANLLEALDTAFSLQQGYVLGLRFTGQAGSSEIGRIFVWESSELVDAAEASAEALPLFRRIEALSEEVRLDRTFELQGYALRPG